MTDMWSLCFLTTRSASPFHAVPSLSWWTDTFIPAVTASPDQPCLPELLSVRPFYHSHRKVTKITLHYRDFSFGGSTCVFNRLFSWDPSASAFQGHYHIWLNNFLFIWLPSRIPFIFSFNTRTILFEFHYIFLLFCYCHFLFHSKVKSTPF